AIASVSVISAGNYSSLPTNAAAQAMTSGTGTGATFNLTWGIKAVTVANPGSGYDSPPASISFNNQVLYRYKLVFEDAFGHQTNASAPFPSAGISLRGTEKFITLTDLPVGPAGTAKRLLYRTVASGDTFK